MFGQSLKIAFATLLLSATAGATKVDSYKNIPAYDKPMAPPIHASDFVPWMKEADYKKELAAASKRQSRMTATAAGISESKPDVQALISKILAAQTPNDIDALIDEADKGYAKLSDDAKFIVAQLVPLRSMRGFIFHIRPLAQKAAMTDGALITVAKSISSAMSVYFPNSKGQLLLSYLETPADNAIWAFFKDSQMQAYLVNTVYAELKTANERLAALSFTQERGIWDNRLFTGEKTYLDNIDRFKFIGEAERYAAISGVKSAMANLYILGAYQIDGLFDFYDGIGKTIGFGALSQFFGGSLSGATAADRIRIVSSLKKSHPGFMQLVPDENQTVSKDDEKLEPSPCPSYRCYFAGERMRVAFDFFKESEQAAHLAWNENQKSPDDLWAAMDPAVLRPFSRQNNASFDNLDRMLKGRDTFYSAITNQHLVVDVPALFNTPPWDLTAFMPTKSKGGAEFMSKTSSTGTKYQIRDYSAGRGLEWNFAFYSMYFPGTSNADDVKRDAQVISQVWGGGVLALPMSVFFL